MGYLYIFETSEYVKLGKTVNPDLRLRTHASEIGEQIRYELLWRCDMFHEVEAGAKRILAHLPKITSERFIADVSEVKQAIIVSANMLGAKLIEHHGNLNYTNVKSRKRKNKKDKRFDMRVDREWLARFDRMIERTCPGMTRSEFIIKSVNDAMKGETKTSYMPPKEILEELQNHDQDLDIPELLATAIDQYIKRTPGWESA